MRTISSTYLKLIFTGCLELGADKSELSNIIPGRISDLNNPSIRFDAEIATRLLNQSAQKLNNPSIGVEIGLMHRPANLLDLGYAFPFCENLREVMALNRTYQSLIQQIGTTKLQVDEKSAFLIWTPYYAADEAEHYRYFTEMLFSGYSKIGRWLLYGSDNPILSTQFQHSAPETLDVHHQVFSENIKFNAVVDRIDFCADVINVSMPSRNPDMVAHLKERLDRQLAELERPRSTSTELLRYIQNHLVDGRPSLPEVAAVLGMSERTLRRKLKAEGESFSAILARARKESCEAYLRSDQFSQSEIGLILGFADHSAYSRAFKSWFGVTPSAYRAELTLR